MVPPGARGIALSGGQAENVPGPMRRLPLALALLLLSPAAGRADRFWALQLRGGGVILATDAPEERGALLVFHRHPGREFSSLRAEDVRRITIAEGPARKPRRSLDGEVMIFGRDADPPDRRDRPRRIRIASALRDDGEDPGSGAAPGYGPYVYLAGIPLAPPPPRPGRFPALVRPNGFPILGPPGAPGFAPPAIGPNGYPDLAPTALPLDGAPPPPLPPPAPRRRGRQG